MNEVPTSLEPVEAWRGWHLRLDRSGLSLLPIGKGAAWPRRRVAEARCWSHRRHRAPEASCRCGLYATVGLDLLRRARSPAVLGRVALWGRVIQHARGWRAEFAYPQSIALVCPACLAQAGIGGSSPAAVTLHRDRSLIPACEYHLELAGVCGWRRFEVLSTDDIQAGLAEAYAVDRFIPSDDG